MASTEFIQEISVSIMYHFITEYERSLFQLTSVRLKASFFLAPSNWLPVDSIGRTPTRIGFTTSKQAFSAFFIARIVIISTVTSICLSYLSSSWTRCKAQPLSGKIWPLVKDDLEDWNDWYQCLFLYHSYANPPASACSSVSTKRRNRQEWVGTKEQRAKNAHKRT